MRKIKLTLFYFMLSIVLLAQSPQGISHQAVIRNASNVLVTNSTVGIKISILQGSAAGGVVYSETHLPTSNANGLISFIIGQGTILSGDFANINWSAGPYFIKTEADPEGGTSYTISGTSQMLSVPYALYAKTAETSAETDPVFSVSPAGSITNAQINNWNTAASSSTDGYLTSGDWTAFNNKENPLTLTNGLTRTTNTVKLGGNLTESTIIAQDAAESLTFTNNGTARTAINLSGTGDFQIQDNGDAFFTATDGGNIGIGTTAPGHKLTVSDGNIALTNSGTAREMMFYEPSASGSNYSSLKARAQSTNITYTLPVADGSSGQVLSTNGSGVLSWSSAGSGNQIYDADNDTKILVEETADDDVIRFDAAGNEKMKIDNTGLVLPNTTSSSTGVVYKGTDRFIHNYKPASNDGKNTFIGVNAGNFSMGGGIASNASYNTGFGYSVLQSNTSGYHNTANGYEALKSNTSGAWNTASGSSALMDNTSGSYNTAMGYSALTNNTTGTNNSATGNFAMLSNTTGNFNTANGNYALYFNTTGNENAANGNYALYNNTTGAKNTAHGSYALYSNKGNSRSTAVGYAAMYYADDYATGVATYNTAVGYEALRGGNIPTNNGGNGNTAIGDQALFSNTSGSDNTATGRSALYSNTEGINNIAYGYRALYSNTTGQDNIAIGDETLYSNTTGEKNTAAGFKALHRNKANSYSTAYGFMAMQFADDTQVGGYTANVAIGAFALRGNSTPAFNTGKDNTAIGNNALTSNTSGSYNTACGSIAMHNNTEGEHNTATGFSAMRFHTNGDNNTAYGSNSFLQLTTGYDNTGIGAGAGHNIETGYRNTFLGKGAKATTGNIYNSTAIGYNAEIYANNQIVLGDGLVSTLYCKGAWVGTVFANYRDLYVDNTGKIGYVASSMRYKDNITGVSDISWLYRLRPVNFTYKNDPGKTLQYGLIAEEVEKVIPRLVSYNEEGVPETVTYSSLITPMLKALQEDRKLILGQMEKIKILEQEIQELKRQK